MGFGAKDAVCDGQAAGHESDAAFKYRPVDPPRDQKINIYVLAKLDSRRLKVGDHSEDGCNDSAFKCQ